MNVQQRQTVNSLWHSTDELPDMRANIIILTSNGRLIDNREKQEVSFKVWCKWIHAKKWAYLKDLIPE